MTNEYRGITKRSRQLIARQEGIDVDFKRQTRGIESVDLVAFANSDVGGAILVGVDEATSESGVQRGVVVGCPVNDSAKLSILNKAEDCVPPVEIEIVVENLNRNPFLRVEIPCERNCSRPYCTKRGLYAIRGDGRTKALLPGRLLTLFAETDSAEFIRRYQQATAELEATFTQVQRRLEDELQKLQERVFESAMEIDIHLERISNSAEGAFDSSDMAAGFADETLGQINQLDERLMSIESEIWHMQRSLWVLINHFDLEAQLTSS